MDKQYYFMFSRGEYSDYCVGGLYICDHEVSEEEWTGHKKEMRAFAEKAKPLALEQFYARTGLIPVARKCIYPNPSMGEVRPPTDWYGSTELKEFENATNIQETFVKKHNMTPVEYNEMWED